MLPLIGRWKCWSPSRGATGQQGVSKEAIHETQMVPSVALSDGTLKRVAVQFRGLHDDFAGPRDGLAGVSRDV